MLKLVGYWKSPDEPSLPDPRDFIVKDKYSDEEKIIISDYLKSGQTHKAWKGFSGCRICGERLGTKCLTDGTWQWPEKLEHYLIHDVVLPEEFIDAIRLNYNRK